MTAVYPGENACAASVHPLYSMKQIRYQQLVQLPHFGCVKEALNGKSGYEHQGSIHGNADPFQCGCGEGLEAVYQFDLTGDNGGKYNLAIDDGQLTVTEGTHASPSITITMAANDYLDMSNGKLNPQMAFMSGKLKIAGDMGLAMKMQQLFPLS